MARFIANYTNFVAPSSTQVLKSGSGKVHAIFASSTSTTPGTIYLYDNTSGSGNILLSIKVAAPQPVCIVLPAHLKLTFYVGLTVVTPANVSCYLVTEESEESFAPPTADFTSMHCRVFNSADQAISPTTFTNIYFDTEQSDEGSMHSTVSDNDRITFPQAGYFIFGGCFCFAANATGLRVVRILKNGANYLVEHRTNSVGGTYPTYISIASGYDFAEDDYIVAQVWQNSGGSLNISSVNYSSPVFWAARIL